MEQNKLFETDLRHRLEGLTREQLIEFNQGQADIIVQYQKHILAIEAFNCELQQKTFFIEDQHIILKNKMFGKSSEKSANKENFSELKKPKAPGSRKILLPSERYPDAPLIERDVELEHLPSCKCCNAQMTDSGMTEDSEFLTVIPAQFFVVRQKRHKYRCGKCHGDIVTAPSPLKIKPGSSYSDEMVVDVALTKYCDLIPMERYSSIAGRAGLSKLPPQSLIECSHYLADFIKEVYHKLKTEICASIVLHADETPHRMLEGSAKLSWYLWGFSSETTAYFECHDTRSGDIASELLKNSKCEYLMSDVFSGYHKATSVTNDYRELNKLNFLINIYCNAHARRKFKDAAISFSEVAKFYINQYRKIYRLENLAKKYPDLKQKIRFRLRKYFEKMKTKALSEMTGYSSKSSIYMAMNYFLKNYVGFTRFIDNISLPIDNNPQERLLRNPVIGRKTWYGTHSERGAETSAILFSLVESCKLNKINPRIYFKNLVQDLHLGKNPYTPKEFKDLQSI